MPPWLPRAARSRAARSSRATASRSRRGVRGRRVSSQSCVVAGTRCWRSASRRASRMRSSSVVGRQEFDRGHGAQAGGQVGQPGRPTRRRCAGGEQHRQARLRRRRSAGAAAWPRRPWRRRRRWRGRRASAGRAVRRAAAGRGRSGSARRSRRVQRCSRWVLPQPACAPEREAAAAASRRCGRARSAPRRSRARADEVAWPRVARRAGVAAAAGAGPAWRSDGQGGDDGKGGWRAGRRWCWPRRQGAVATVVRVHPELKAVCRVGEASDAVRGGLRVRAGQVKSRMSAFAQSSRGGRMTRGSSSGAMALGVARRLRWPVPRPGSPPCRPAPTPS